jgi:hypothetical protein
MKAAIKKKIDLLEGLSSGERTTDELIVKSLAKIYTEFSDKPGEYLNDRGEPRTKEQIEEECRCYYPFIVTIVTPEDGPYEIPESEDEVEMD